MEERERERERESEHGIKEAGGKKSRSFLADEVDVGRPFLRQSVIPG